MSCPSVRISSSSTVFRDIGCRKLLLKPVEKIEALLKSDTNNRYLTRSTKYRTRGVGGAAGWGAVKGAFMWVDFVMERASSMMCRLLAN
jgi:hypothetical protein